jgi:two-component system OmpR family response regulator
MKKRILLADDDEGVRASLGQVLAMEGYEVLPAANGRQAVAWLRSELPDLALLDINMPGLDGWQTLERIERRRPFLPLIVITARPHQYPRAVGAGVDALMEKPLHVPMLLGAIDELLGESLPQRMARLTRPDFATRFLNPPEATVDS